MHSHQWLLLTLAMVAAVAQHSSAAPPVPHPAQAAAAPAFGFDAVQRLAQQRAEQPYQEQSDKLPDSLAKLSYDDYRDIRFRPENALWRNQTLFEVQFFHRGSTYEKRVNVNEVTDQGVTPVRYDPSQFDFGRNTALAKALPPDLGYAGLRVHYPLQTAEYKDELIAFLGASYFRVLGRGQSYGASARGLAINVATTQGEEFPYFSDFWLVKPGPMQRSLTIYALLDSPSLAGAYRFEIRPGATTDVEVTATLYARKSVDKLGVAPLTSMYLYGEEHRRQFDDYRPEVHDSDGLLMQAGGGEWLWRPLSNPKALRVTSFSDEHPRGFGLSQRDRDFAHYQDEESGYQRRPSYWIAPLGDWGKGSVELVEIPTDEEIHDNIVSYWVPATHLVPHKPFTFTYLLSAYASSPLWPPGGRAVALRTGAVRGHAPENSRRVLIDFTGGDLDTLGPTQPVKAVLSAQNGDIDSVTVQRLSENGIWRVAFRLTPKGNQATDLRCYLTLYGEALTETWTYLWTP
ncbi:MAG TPA: glucan biosynthesis protein G [Steroidobacteraceae bacterium]